MAQTTGAVEAVRFQAAVTNHSDNLSVFLAILFENKLTLVAITVILSPPSILSSLSFSIRTERVALHLCSLAWG
jgi:hypothetical protein